MKPMTRFSEQSVTGPVQVLCPLPPSATLIGQIPWNILVTLKIEQYVFPKRRNKLYYKE